jgi:uncharacterized protein YdeI (YjbR/CyaY-like superfamily)
MADAPIKTFDSPEEWREWLQNNHSTSDGIFFRLYKKGSGEKTLDYQSILDEALCFGWIDAIRKSYDEVSFLQKFTPRRPRSIWSKRNCENVERLIKGGRMASAGLSEIDRAKNDGRWDRAYDAQSDMTVPDDFLDKLKKNSKAAAFFETLNSTNRFAVAFRLHNAKRSETRAKRIDLFIEKFANGEKLV